MITATNILYLYTETPLHVGTGSGLSNVDLPIQRERTTQYPMIQGSGIKGKLRATAESEKLVDLDAIFGSSRTTDNNANNGTQTRSSDEQKDYAGALIAGDARILLFPVRSLNGIFAYVTCYHVLRRFASDLERSQAPLPEQDRWNIPDPPDEKNAEGPQASLPEQDRENAPGPIGNKNAEMPITLVTNPSEITIQSRGSQQKTLVLEEFSFQASEDQVKQEQVNKIAGWLAQNTLPTYRNDGEGAYWQNKLKKSLVILPDNDFRDFVLYATEIITRIQIGENKTVKEGALWTEEHLPADTLLYVPIYATNSRRNGHNMTGEQVLQNVSKLNSKPGSYLQLGGDETVGRGITRTRWGNIQTLEGANKK